MEFHVYHCNQSIPCVGPVLQSHVGKVGLSCVMPCVPLQLVYPVCLSCPTVLCRTGGTVLWNSVCTTATILSRVRPLLQSHVGQVGLSCGIPCVPLYPVCPSCPTVPCTHHSLQSHVWQGHLVAFVLLEKTL